MGPTVMGGSGHPLKSRPAHTGANARSTCSLPQANCNQLQGTQQDAHALTLLSHIVALLGFLTPSFNIWAAQSYEVHGTHTRMKLRRDRGGRDLPLRCCRLGRLPDGSRHLCKTCVYRWALPGEHTAHMTSRVRQGEF